MDWAYNSKTPMTIARIEPIPTQARYDQEYKAASEELILYGGIRTHLANRALQVKFDPSMAEQDISVSKLGVRFVDDTLLDDNESYEAAYAFTNGFMIVNTILDRIYESPHTIQDRLSPAIDWLSRASLEGVINNQDQLDQEMQRLTEFGVYGTRQLGGTALAHLVEWSNEAYPQYERSAMMFCLGGGTAVTGAQCHQRRINAELIYLMSGAEISYENFIAETATDDEL